MKIKLVLISVLIISSISLISYQVSYALFADSASSQNNTFSTAEEFPVTAPLTSPQPGDIVINEIMWMGSQLSSFDEWLELRNTTSSSIDLAGWKLEGAASGSTVITIPSGIIPSNGLFLISNFSATSSSSILNVTPDFITSTLQIDNSALQILLKTPSDAVIDTADDGISTPHAGSNSTPKKSMERNLIPGDGTQTSSWHTSSRSANLDPTATESATPKAPNS